MKIQKIEVVNFKNLDSHTLVPAGQHVYVLGGNGRGKSSFIDAVFGVLTGADLPSKLVRDGQKNGYVALDLGEYKVEATFTAKTEKLNLRLTSADGVSHAAPRTLLDKLVGTVQFDIAAFLAKTPRKQADYLQQLVGLDFGPLNAQYSAAFDERTFANRWVKELEAQYPCEAPEALEPIDTAELSQQFRDLAQMQQEHARVSTDLRESGLHQQRCENELIQLEAHYRSEKDRLLAAINESVQQVEHHQQWLAANVLPDASALSDELTAAQQHNNKVEARRHELAGYRALADGRRKQADLNTALARIEAEKAALLAATPLPVPGMSIAEEGHLLLDGLPFAGNQINTARQLIAGLQICRHLHKQVPIARLDGSLLDKNSRAEVLAWADAQGLQLFVELVDQEGGALRLDVVEAGISLEN